MPSSRAARWRPAHWSLRNRRIGGAFAVLLILCAMGLTGYRTLRPAEDLSRATAPLPSPAQAEALPYGELISAPLVVEGRLRIFAEQRRVWAETPVTATQQVTPHWSYRRWPEEVVGVITVERSFLWGGPALVITKWSDGAVVAREAATGDVAWQAHVDPDPDETYHGRRTGGQTVYAPEGMFTALSATDGRLVLLVAGKDQIHAYDPYTGAERWSHVFTGDSGCHRDDWTGETTYIVKDSCAAPATLSILDAGTGAAISTWRPSGASAGPAKEANWFVQPMSCVIGHSRCQLFLAAATSDTIAYIDAARGKQGIVPDTWAVDVHGVVRQETGVQSDAALVSGDVRVEPMLNGYVWAHSRSTGALLWISTRPAMTLAVDGSSAYLADRDRDLLVVDIQTGLVTTMIDSPPRYGNGWLAGYVYVHDGFLAIERLGSGRESDDDLHYYYAPAPVLLVGV
jgi:outer membrane protein assembly factor BamB